MASFNLTVMLQNVFADWNAWDCMQYGEVWAHVCDLCTIHGSQCPCSSWRLIDRICKAFAVPCIVHIYRSKACCYLCTSSVLRYYRLCSSLSQDATSQIQSLRIRLSAPHCCPINWSDLTHGLTLPKVQLQQWHKRVCCGAVQCCSAAQMPLKHAHAPARH